MPTSAKVTELVLQIAYPVNAESRVTAMAAQFAVSFGGSPPVNNPTKVTAVAVQFAYPNPPPGTVTASDSGMGFGFWEVW